MSRENVATNEKAAIQLLQEIATSAGSLHDLLIDMECEGTNLSAAALPLFRVFAEKIGWMADLAAKQITGFAPIKGDAEDWLLSPASCDAVQSTKEKLTDGAG